MIDHPSMPIQPSVVRDLAAARAELLEIHAIGMCIAECPPAADGDTWTVRMVKSMARRINAKEAPLPAK